MDVIKAELRTVSANVLHGPKDGVLFAKLIEREFDIIQDSG